MVLVVDDDPDVAEGIVALLEREGRTVVVCNDAESAQMALREYPFTHVISDLQLSSVPFEGVHLVDAARRAQPDSRIVVISGYASHIVKSAALAVGADAFLAKPFAREDIEAALGDTPADGPETAEAGHLFRVRDVDMILSSRVLEAHFQPVVDLRQDELHLFGFEALARAGDDWPFEDMHTLFEYAAQKRKVVELNAACVEVALRAAAALPGSARLFINVDPPALSSSGFVQVIRKAAASAGVSLSRVILELTENAITYDHASVFRAMDELRADGVEFAVDDAESAVANLRLIEQLRPSIVKISHHLGNGFEADPKKLDGVGRIVGLARLLGAQVVLEGIETAATLDAAQEAGIDFGQGFWLGEPVHANVARKYRVA